MSEDKSKMTPDDFWDISDLIPKKHQAFGYARSTELEEIRSFSSPNHNSQSENNESSTVIMRYIPPNSGSTISSTKESFDQVDSYVPVSSLIHEVTLKKRKCPYRYYQEFLEDSKRYLNFRGESCDYVPFFSYVPQYNQLNDAQLSYYFWFRDCFIRGERIKIDYSYVLLWIYERINLGTLVDVKETQTILTELWYAYHKEFPALSGKLAEWICDFSLLHRLPPPDRANSEMVKCVMSLKEFYISMPDYDVRGCVKSLLKYCSSYDYTSSKFAKEENLPLFEQHVSEALSLAVSFYSSDGKMLSDLAFEDSSLIRDAFAGALCTAENRYRLEIRYCSFSRSNELRFLVGDVVKYAENKIRSYLGIKSRMTVYSLPTELQRILDDYFSVHLSAKKAVKPKREKHEYDKFYDIPTKPLSISEASKIEQDSWETTGKLVSAFETYDAEETEPEIMEQRLDTCFEEIESSDLNSRLGEYANAVISLLEGDKRAIAKLAARLGKMTDALADEVNEIAFEVYGDALIEEQDDGYTVIEDYQEYLKK